MLSFRGLLFFLTIVLFFYSSKIIPQEYDFICPTNQRSITDPGELRNTTIIEKTFSSGKRLKISGFTI